jgi:hypothetical protein
MRADLATTGRAKSTSRARASTRSSVSPCAARVAFGATAHRTEVPVEREVRRRPAVAVAVAVAHRNGCGCQQDDLRLWSACPGRSESTFMYIGGGTILVILVIVVIVLLLRRG